jgi:hypothetical protein
VVAVGGGNVSVAVQEPCDALACHETPPCAGPASVFRSKFPSCRRKGSPGRSAEAAPAGTRTRWLAGFFNRPSSWLSRCRRGTRNASGRSGTCWRESALRLDDHPSPRRTHPHPTARLRSNRRAHPAYLGTAHVVLEYGRRPRDRIRRVCGYKRCTENGNRSVASYPR